MFDKDKNPLASFNVTVGQFYAFKNDIQPDKTRDHVTMTRFEPSFSVFVDRLKVVELPIHFADRRDGESKMNLRVQLESALIPFLLRRRAH